MKTALALRVLALWAVLGSAVSEAQSASTRPDILTPEERAWLETHPDIRVSPFSDYAPVDFVDEQGQHKGISADYLALIQERLGIKFKVSRLEPGEFPNLTNGDVIPACAETPGRLKALKFSKPYLDFPVFLITRKSADSNLKLSDLSGTRVAVVQTDAVRHHVAKSNPQIVLDLVPDTKTGLRKVSFGLVDAFVSELPAALHWMEREGITNLKVAGEIDYVYHLSFTSRIEWPELNTIIDKGLSQIVPSEREAIYNKWVRLQVDPAPVNRRVLLGLAALAGTALLGVGGFFFWNRSLSAQVERRTSELQDERGRLHELTRHLQTVREDERKRISREVHDELGQALTALKIDLSQIDKNLTAEQDAVRAQTSSMKGLIDDTIRVVRRIASDLRPGMLDDLGLAATLEWHAHQFSERTGIKVVVDADEAHAPDADRATTVFRICQEALTNVARHAEAKEVRVALSDEPGALVLRVQDDGRGLDEAALARTKSLGVLGMRERARVWGGDVTVTGAQGQGTTVEARIPTGKIG